MARAYSPRLSTAQSPSNQPYCTVNTREVYRSREAALREPIRRSKTRARTDAIARGWELFEHLRSLGQQKLFANQPEPQPKIPKARARRERETHRIVKELCRGFIQKTFKQVEEQAEELTRNELEARLEPLALEEDFKVFDMGLDATDEEICGRARAIAESIRDMLYPRDGDRPFRLEFVLQLLTARYRAIPRFRANDTDETKKRILTDEQSWRRAIRREMRRAGIEFDRRMGLARNRKFVSDIRLRERRQQHERNQNFVEKHVLVDPKTGEQVKMRIVVERAGRARTAEIKRVTGQLSELADKENKTAIFLTFTLPSRFHIFLSHGGDNPNYDLNETVESGINWLARRRKRWQNHMRARMRPAERAREPRIGKMFGVEGVEAHVDGTAHLHNVVFCDPEDVDEILKLARRHFIFDDAVEPDEARIEHGMDAQLARSNAAAGYYAIKYSLESAGKPAPATDFCERTDDYIETDDDRARADAWRSATSTRSFHTYWLGYVRPAITHYRELRRIPTMDPHHPLFRLYSFARAKMFAAFVREYQRTPVATLVQDYLDKYERPGTRIVGVCDKRTGEAVISRLRHWTIQPAPPEPKPSKAAEQEKCCSYYKEAEKEVTETAESPKSYPEKAQAPPRWDEGEEINRLARADGWCA